MKELRIAIIWGKHNCLSTKIIPLIYSKEGIDLYILKSYLSFCFFGKMGFSKVLYLLNFLFFFQCHFCSAQSLPIKATKTISFSTYEGSYMNLDISNDGHFLSFDLLGEIYTLSVSGGKARQLTRGLAVNEKPFWYGDRHSIAFLSDDTGSKRWTLLDLPSGKRQILEKENQIPLLKIQTDTIVTVGSEKYKGIVSPNRKFCAYVRSKKNAISSLVMRTLTDGSDRILVPSLLRKDSLGRYSQTYCFSPDSKLIYISYGGEIHKISVENGKDEVIPFQADVSVEMGKYNYHQFDLNNSTKSKNLYARYGQLSDDGKYLVFAALNKIYVTNLANKTTKSLNCQSEGQFQPALSPDGKWIAYVSWNDTIGGFLWKSPLTGGNPVRLTSLAAKYQRPSWSPDGKVIGVVKSELKEEGKVIMGEIVLNDRDDAGRGDLLLVDISDSGKIVVLAKKVPLWNQISFTDNGNSVLYMPYDDRFENSRGRLVKRDRTTGETDTLIAPITGDNQYCTQRLISKDLRYMVYSMAEDLYVYDLKDKNLAVTMRFGNGVDPHWEENGNKLAWTYGNQYFRIDFRKVIERFKESSFNGDLKPDDVFPLEVDINPLYGKGTIVLKGAGVITIKGEQPLENATIIIKDGRIGYVGNNNVVVQKGWKVLDLTGKTIIPGLIDLHCHMRLAPDVFPNQSWLLLANLAFGVTTVRDPSSSYDSFGYADLLKTGKMLGPRLYSVGRSVNPAFSINVDDFDNVNRTVQKRILLGAETIKQYVLPDRLRRQWLLEASRLGKVNMTNEGDDWLSNLAMIKDGSTGLEHNPDWGWNDAYGDITTFMAKSRIFFTPTLQVSSAAKKYLNKVYWSQKNTKLERYSYSDGIVQEKNNGAESLETIQSHDPVNLSGKFLSDAEVVNSIHSKGGKIGVGGHGNDEGIATHNEIWALTMGGMSNIDALKSATIVGAEALGLQRHLGTIEVGKIADLIILDRNPLEDIRNTRAIKYVMKDGVLYDGETLDRIWPFFDKCPNWKLNVAK